MSNNIQTLRDALFDTLRALRDDKNPMEIDRARVVCEVARELTSTAKVEIDYLRVTSSTTGSGFLGANTAAPSAPALPGTTQTETGLKTVAPIPGGSITTHRMR